MANNNPCRDCTERSQWCHSKCQRYNEWKREHDDTRRRIREERVKEFEFLGYQADVHRSLKKKGWR